ncbi:TolC family outer membrane protein [Bradyrhizobium sp. LHD-71]|uniref:TolC family outer membrane protein n=1 Tax=Bradyrhizobium sp. LHD-71 TaxID=3072141 RepID=UPI0028101EBA|nr:TolC family outer membrane protein [Bradyrhizobium sp. LHD-71]MDQ8730083.1 TolC family outer membrane protein [Bradyrhizobium sp. LHD-71]
MALFDGRKAIAGVAALAFAFGFVDVSRADTINAALARAYQNNPQLNAQRASVRATDETVPQALSGYRPRVSVEASVAEQYTDALSVQRGFGQQLTTYAGNRGWNVPRSVGATVTQPVFNGYQTANRTRAAESQVSAAREGLRVLEQTVLLAAATIYMDYLRDAAIVEVQRSNTRVLEQTLKQVRDRFSVGEVTRTDVAQSEAQLAAGRSQLLVAESNLTTTRANFRRIIGNDPTALAPGAPVDRFLPPTLPGAIEQGLIRNPNVTAAMYGIDVSFLNVKVAEGALFPTVNLVASVQQSYESTLVILKTFSASVGAQVSVPIYQGGAEYSLIRQNKETLAQQRLVLEQVRDQARATVAQSWGELQAAKSQIASAQAQVTASETALNGVREEARVGQRTTLDVLNAQQALVNARVSLVTAQRDRVVASYSLLAAVGTLSPSVLGLATSVYDPTVHYHQVRDAWGGVRTPDGR